MTFLKLAFISIFENELTEIFKIKDKAKNQKRYRYFFVWVYFYQQKTFFITVIEVKSQQKHYKANSNFLILQDVILNFVQPKKMIQDKNILFFSFLFTNNV